MLTFSSTIIETAILAEMLDKRDSSGSFIHSLYSYDELHELVLKRYGLSLQDSEVYWGIDALHEDFLEGSCGLLRIAGEEDVIVTTDSDGNEVSFPDVRKGKYVWAMTNFGGFSIGVTPNIFSYKLTQFERHLEYINNPLGEPTDRDFYWIECWKKVREDVERVWEYFVGTDYEGNESKLSETLSEYYHIVDIRRKKKWEEKWASSHKDDDEVESSDNEWVTAFDYEEEEPPF